MEITEENLKNPNRWSFDEAAVSFSTNQFSKNYILKI